MRKILPWINYNGKMTTHEKAGMSPFDDGFQYGYGVFTTLKVREGTPLFFEKHEERLKNSLKKLSFALELTGTLYKAVEEVITKNEMEEGAVRITITKGVENKSTILIHATSIDKEVQTVSVITIPDTRDEYKTIKMTYRVPHMIAMQQAKKQGAQDALFCHNDYLIESTYANIYSCTSDGEISTPPIAGRALDSISRKMLFEQLPMQEKEISKTTTDAMVLVSSVSMRIVEGIDGRNVKRRNDFIGTIQNALEKAERNYITAHTSHEYAHH